MVMIAALLAQKPNDDDEGDDGDDDESGNYSLVENTIHAYEPWTLRGAADDWFILNFTNNWVFPHDSNHWTQCVVLTSGQVWDTTRGTNRLVAVGQQMSAVPDESCFTYELTDDNSYLLTWSNFFLNRDTNQPITASIELKRNGDWIATSNRVCVAHEMAWPYGATNTLPTTAEIESINDGQFLLHAVFPEDVEERVALTITTGTNLWRYCVGSGGEHVFPLDKGREYEISVSWNQGSAAPCWPPPDCDGVEFSCSDGVETPDDEIVWWREWDNWRWHLRWRPQLIATPATVTVNADGSASADLVAWLPLNGAPDYSWSSFLDLARFTNPSASSTRLLSANGVSWLTVVARTDYYSATGAVEVVYLVPPSASVETNQTESVTAPVISVTVPPFMTVRDQADGELVPVVVSFRSPTPTNGTVRLILDGSSGPFLWETPAREGGTNYGRTWQLSGTTSFCVTNWLACLNESEVVNEDSVRVEWENLAGGLVTDEKRYTVLRFSQEPITLGRKTVDGVRHVINPCCAVVGEKVYLAARLDMPDSFTGGESRIDWTCESGIATFPDGATGDEVSVIVQGEDPVVVEAHYRDYPEKKMRFSLRPVTMRTVTVFPCEVLSADDERPSFSLETVNAVLADVNEIYRQVGLRFVATNFVTVVNKEWNEDGLTVYRSGAQLRNFMRNTGGLEVYFIKGNDKPDGNGIRARGKCSPYGIIVKKATGYLTLAHEIGHACGWDDIYVPEDDEDLEDLPAFAENLPNDWGCYQLGTLQSDLVKRLLMFGKGTLSRGDIPSGPVYGVRRVASGSSFFRTELVPVGLNVMQIQMSR